MKVITGLKDISAFLGISERCLQNWLTEGGTIRRVVQKLYGKWMALDDRLADWVATGGKEKQQPAAETIPLDSCINVGESVAKNNASLSPKARTNGDPHSGRAGSGNSRKRNRATSRQG